ncbi:hypothetical protein DW973_04300 [Parabacteroides merdae]|nr:hypothetical protein DW973_04300 [Parabacteroides merdae]
MQPLLGSDQLPREGEQAVNINTKVNEIIKSSSALPSVKTGGRQKQAPAIVWLQGLRYMITLQFFLILQGEDST